MCGMVSDVCQQFHTGSRQVETFDNLYLVCSAKTRISRIEIRLYVKGKGNGLGTCYSAAYKTRTAALYSLGSGS